MGEASTAYPGGRRDDRAPCSAGTASTRLIADAEGFNAPEGYTRTTVRARRCRSAGVHRPWHAGREASKNLGSPRRSWTWKILEEGIQLLRHGRGNPDTEQCWNLRSTVDHGTGKRGSTATGKARRKRMGCLITRSTQRWGKPTTRGRT